MKWPKDTMVGHVQYSALEPLVCVKAVGKKYKAKRVGQGEVTQEDVYHMEQVDWLTLKEFKDLLAKVK